MTTSGSRWNAFEILDVDPRSTCVGFTKKGGRCGQSFISNADRNAAAVILQNMSERDVQSANFDHQLRSLATCLLCPRWHKGKPEQLTTKTEEWKTAIRSFRAAENKRDVRPRATETSTRTSASIAARVPTTSCLAETLESLRGEIATLNERYATVLQLASTAQDVSSIPPRAIHRVDSTSISPVTSRSTQAEGSNFNSGSAATSLGASVAEEFSSPAQAQELPEEEEARRTVSRTSISQPQSFRQGPASTPPVPESGEQSVTDSAIRIPSKQRIEGECSICSEEMANGTDVSWCKTQCGQNFHADCVDHWLDIQKKDGRVPTCPYW